MNIRTKILVFLLPLMLISVGTMTLFSKRAVQTVIGQEVAKRAISNAIALAQAPETILGFRTGSEKLLLPALQSVMENTETIYAMALDPAGQVLAHTNVAEKGKLYNDTVTRQALQADRPGYRQVETGGQPAMDIFLPVWEFSKEDSGEEFLLLGVEPKARLGTLRLGVPLSESLETADRISGQVFWIVAVVSGLVLTLTLVFSRRILLRIGLLVEAAEKVGGGRVGETVPVLSSDEIGNLARSFNQMSRDLAETTVSKDFLNSILEDMLDALVVTTPEGRIRLINKSALDLLDYTEAEAVGRPLDALLTEETDVATDAWPGRLFHGDIIRNLEGTLVTKAGRKIPALISASAFGNTEGGVDGFIATAKDITERKRMEEALRTARDGLEQAVKERTAELHGINASLQREISERKHLEEQLRQSQKMEAVGTLAGGVAHDFNNQLGVIRGYLDMVLEDLPEGSDAYNDLVEIGKAVQHSARLTEQLLMFSSRQPVDMGPMDLNHLLRDLENMLGRLLGENIRINPDLADDLWTVTADLSNINQVITNLSVNARDAMPEGGALTIQTRNVTIDSVYCSQFPEARPGRFVCLAVVDTGEGMDEHVRARLFEPFFTTKGRGRGTGLGLSVVYGIVLAHQGWITVDSQPGQGSRFEIYLPVMDRDEVVGAADPERVSLGRFNGEGERILLIEDEPGLRQVTQRVLEDRGYVVRACSTATEAVAAFGEAAESFDLVLSDVVLPDGRGPDLVFGFLKERPDLKALLVTGYTDERADWNRVREAGLTLLQKPVAMAVLLEHVHRVLAETGRTPSPFTEAAGPSGST